MKILIVGGGGREHALAYSAAKSKLVSRIYVAPGNAGTAAEPCVENVNIKTDDLNALVDFASLHKIDMTIVGPELPLVAGIVDLFNQHGLSCLGPTRAAAQLEGSKIFARDFLSRNNIPAPSYKNFSDADAACAYLDSVTFPVVIKADGLAAGKGVVIAQTRTHAETTLSDMLVKNRFGDAGARVLIEEFIVGEEASFIVLAAGETLLPLASSQDHKHANDGDRGANTGGMGAYSPAPIIDPAMHEKIIETIMRPTLRAMAADGITYTGFLYAGLMIDANNIPRVLEFNCRLGDPEAQVILMRLRSDLIAHAHAALNGDLRSENAEWDPRAALGVVIAAPGYPNDYKSDDIINGLDAADEFIGDDDARKIFHSGTAQVDNKIVTAGGRVLCAAACANSVSQAQQNAYALVDKINWRGSWHRSDIGHRAIAREKNKPIN